MIEPRLNLVRRIAGCPAEPLLGVFAGFHKPRRIGNRRRRQCLGGSCRCSNHGSRLPAHALNTPRPAVPERAPGTQSLKESEPLIANLPNEQSRIRFGRGGNCQRTNLAVHGRSDELLQSRCGTGISGIHPIVEYAIIDAGRKLIAGQRVPIVQPVDRFDLFLRRLPYVCGQARVGCAPVVPLVLSYAAGSASAGIAGIVIVSTLRNQGQGDAGRETVEFRR